MDGYQQITQNINKNSQFLLKAAGFAIAWTFLITFFASELTRQPIWAQFLIATAIFYAVPAVIIGKLSKEEGRKRAIGTFLVIAAADLLVPPLAVGFDGQLLPTQQLLWGSAIDVFLHTVWNNFADGFLLWALVYPFSFFILLLFATVLITGRKVQEVLTR